MKMIKKRFQHLALFLGERVDANDYDLGIFPLPDDRFEAMKKLEALRQYTVASIIDDMEAAGLHFAPIALRLRMRRVFKEIERQNRIVEQGFRLYMGGVFDKVAARDRRRKVAVMEDDARRAKHVYVQGPGPAMRSLRDGRVYSENQRIRMKATAKDFVPL